MATQQRNPSPLFVGGWRHCFVLFLFDSVIWAPQQLNPCPFLLLVFLFCFSFWVGAALGGLQETPLQKSK